MPLLLVYLAFIAIALPDGLLGVAWPSMRAGFGAPVSALGILLPFGIGAYVLSSSATGFMLARLGIGRLLALSTAISAAALLGTSAAPGLWAVVLAGVPFGLGAGAIDGGLNAYAAKRFGARHITWMHASYCLGATLGPLVITASLTAGLSWRWAYAAVAAAQAFLATGFALTATRRPWTPAGSRSGADSTSAERTGRSPERIGSSPRPKSTAQAIMLSAAVFAVETGIESGTALWAYVFLTDGRGLPNAAAGLGVSGYWAAMFAGRVLLGPVSERIGPRRCLTGGVVGTLVATALMTGASGYGGMVGVMLLGFTAAPMFPLLTLTTADRVGERHADRMVGVQVAASSIGAATLPAALGLVIDHAGTAWFAPCLLIQAGCVGAIYLGLSRLRSVGSVVAGR